MNKLVCFSFKYYLITLFEKLIMLSDYNIIYYNVLLIKGLWNYRSTYGKGGNSSTITKET